MNETQKLSESFKTTFWLIDRFAQGLSHEDSVAYPPFKANSFNWILGHILVSRDCVLKLLGQEPMLDISEAIIYETGSDPVQLETAVPLERVLQMLEISQTALVRALEEVTEESMDEIVDDQKGQRVGDELAGLHWHETYHVGQLEILRQVSGDREAFP